MLKFVPQTLPNNVFIIGCGGTGSRVVPLIAQSMASQEWLLGARLTLVDPDVVETKNTTRQNFIEPDVGRHKAAVLAERYSNAFGIEISAITEFVRPTTRLMNQASQLSGKGVGNQAAIFILCVDSAEARRDILKALLNEGYASRDSIIIDAGNEDIFGQVSIANLHPLGGTSLGTEGRKHLADNIPDRAPFEMELTTIPLPLAEYELMEDGEGTGSCADLDQTLAINNMMAATIVGIFQNILYSIPMSFRRINISLNGGMSTDWLDLKWLKGIIRGDVDNRYVKEGSVASPAKPAFTKMCAEYRSSRSLALPVLADLATAIDAKYRMEVLGEGAAA